MIYNYTLALLEYDGQDNVIIRLLINMFIHKYWKQKAMNSAKNSIRLFKLPSDSNKFTSSNQTRKETI